MISRTHLLLIVFINLLAMKCVYAIDPLSTQFFPSIDQNPNDYSTAIGTITVTDSLYKVFQSSVAPGNVHWSIVYSMQNEIQSFQVHVTPSVNISSLSVTMSSLTNAQTGTVISSATSDIVVYREFYMNITTPTAASTTTYMGGFRAEMPDPLIPAKDPYYGQTTNAFPVSVTAHNTQSAWVDVHIPTSAPSGYYSGSVYVSSGNIVVSTMPVVYAVWAWLMPSTASLPIVGSGFGYNGFCNVAYGGTTNCGNYPGANGSADYANTLQWIDGSKQMLDNRYTIDAPSNIYPQTGSFSTYVSSIGPLINGTYPTILPGASLTKVKLQDITFGTGEWQNWASTFTNQGWFPKLFNYLCDEPPNGCSYAQIISSGAATRTYSTPVVPNLVTDDMANSITQGDTNYIDQMFPIIENLDTTGSGNLRSTYNTWLATSSYFVSRQVGSYQDCESAGTCSNGTIGPSNTPAYPNRHIDGQPVANRAFETWAFLNNLNDELYFAVDLCDTQNCPSAMNPWQSVYAFGCNGDGTLMYPSTTTYVTTSSNIPIWVPSMRLKYVRDGMQDYEYENYLTKQGKGSFVQAQIASWMTNGYTFNNSPAGIEAARISMGTAIHQLTYPYSPVTFQGKITIQGTVTVQ